MYHSVSDRTSQNVFSLYLIYAKYLYTYILIILVLKFEHVFRLLDDDEQCRHWSESACLWVNMVPSEISNFRLRPFEMFSLHFLFLPEDLSFSFFFVSFVITKTCLYNFDPLKPHFYIVKLGFTGVYIIFLISAEKHRLWVLVRTASPRRF